MECRYGIYLGCEGSSGPRGRRVGTIFLYYTRGRLRWVSGVNYGDMEAMKAEGQARPEPPGNPGYAYMGYCMLAVGCVASGVVGIYE